MQELNRGHTPLDSRIAVGSDLVINERSNGPRGRRHERLTPLIAPAGEGFEITPVAAQGDVSVRAFAAGKDRIQLTRLVEWRHAEHKIVMAQNTTQGKLPVISSAHIRAARALLGISAEQLSQIAEVPHRTIQRFETADGIPPSRSGTLERVQRALEAAGIEFLGDPVSSPGVRLRRSRV